MDRTQLGREDNVKGEQYLYKNHACEVEVHYNSETRTKIVASIEVVHDHAEYDFTLEKKNTKQITPSIKKAVGKPTLFGGERKRTHDDASTEFGLPTICASNTPTNPSIADLPGTVTSLA